MNCSVYLSSDSITKGRVCISDWCLRLQICYFLHLVNNSPLCLCATSCLCTIVKSRPSSCFFNQRLKSMIINVYSNCYSALYHFFMHTHRIIGACAMPCSALYVHVRTYMGGRGGVARREQSANISADIRSRAKIAAAE